MSLSRVSLVALICVTGFFSLSSIASSAIQQTKGDFEDKFRQLDEVLPTPNVYRNAAGEPGHMYWQQKVDYVIEVKLDEAKRRITASQSITYENNSPDTLKYLWIQLDQNKFRDDSMSALTTTFGGIGNRGPVSKSASGDSPARLSLDALRRQQFVDDTELGYDLQKVADGDGNALKHVIVGTLMRVDLASPLKPNTRTILNLDFAFNIVEEDAVSARAGYEHFADDEREGGNDIFLLAQWFPRLAAYTDYEAWTNKEFIGRGEFTLEFGNYDVSITVPADHIVSSTGELANAKDVLTNAQRKRLEKAETAKRPVFIVTAEERKGFCVGQLT
jgi:predicted secreted protein